MNLNADRAVDHTIANRVIGVVLFGIAAAAATTLGCEKSPSSPRPDDSPTSQFEQCMVDHEFMFLGYTGKRNHCCEHVYNQGTKRYDWCASTK